MITWTPIDLHRNIEEIIFAQKLISVSTSQHPLEFILLKYPDRRIRQLSEIEESKVTARAIREGIIMTEAQMDEVLRARGIWTQEDDEEVDYLREKIEECNKKISDPDLTPSAKELAAELKLKRQKDLILLEDKRERALENTMERLARHAKYDYMVWACSYNIETENHFWSNYPTYCEEVDAELKSKLLSEFLQYLVGHTVEELRFIARSSLWRLDFVNALKSGLKLLPMSAVELTPDQKNLLWWSGYYHSIMTDMMPEDQPDDWTLQDDELLDKHMEAIHKERSKDVDSRRAEKIMGPNTAEKMATRLVMRSHPDYLNREYDQVPVAQTSGDKIDITLSDDPDNESARIKRAKGIKASKKFVPRKTD